MPLPRQTGVRIPEAFGGNPPYHHTICCGHWSQVNTPIQLFVDNARWHKAQTVKKYLAHQETIVLNFFSAMVSVPGNGNSVLAIYSHP